MKPTRRPVPNPIDTFWSTNCHHTKWCSDGLSAAANASTAGTPCPRTKPARTKTAVSDRKLRRATPAMSAPTTSIAPSTTVERSKSCVLETATSPSSPGRVPERLPVQGPEAQAEELERGVALVVGIEQVVIAHLGRDAPRAGHAGRDVQVRVRVPIVARRAADNGPPLGRLRADLDSGVEVLRPDLDPRGLPRGRDLRPELFEHRGHKAEPVAEEARRDRVDLERGAQQCRVGLRQLEPDGPGGLGEGADRGAALAAARVHKQLGALDADLGVG